LKSTFRRKFRGNDFVSSRGVCLWFDELDNKDSHGDCGMNGMKESYRAGNGGSFFASAIVSLF
jgi:hypothetical protein